MSALRKPASDMLFTTDNLLAMPEDGNLYEIIEGELYKSTLAVACVNTGSLTGRRARSKFTAAAARNWFIQPRFFTMTN